MAEVAGHETRPGGSRPTRSRGAIHRSREPDRITVAPADAAEQKQKLKTAGVLPSGAGKKRGEASPL